MITKMRENLKNKKGFTLIELLIVIAIIAILTVIAIPQYTKYRKSAARSRVQGAVRVILDAGGELIAKADQLDKDVSEDYSPSLSVSAASLKENDKYISTIIAYFTDVGNGGYEVVATAIGDKLAASFSCWGSTSDNKISCEGGE